MFLRREDFTGFNVINLENANGSVTYLQVRMLENWMYQVFDPTNNESIGKVQVVENGLVRFFLQFDGSNLDMNVAFYNPEGTMIGEL